MESKEDVPELVLENPESGLRVMQIDDSQQLEDRDLIVHPFKRLVNSLRAKRSRQPFLQEKYVEGWPGDGSNGLSPYHVVHDQQWEQLSGYSSQLGTVKTSSMSIGSQSAVRSRGTTQSTTNHSNSDPRTSIDSLKPTLSPGVDEAAHGRSMKRRQILQEIVDTESDYVSGLKSLSNVCPQSVPDSTTDFVRCSVSFRSGRRFAAMYSGFARSMIVSCLSSKVSPQSAP